MNKKLYKNILDIQLFNEGSFIFDFKSKEILLSNEISLILNLKNNSKKSYLAKEFFEEFVVLDNYEEFVLSVYNLLKESNKNLFFENIKLKDTDGVIHEFTVKGKLYGDIDNLRLVGELFEKEYYVGNRPMLMMALNVMPDSILIVKDNCIFFANTPAFELFNYDRPQDIIGKNIFTRIRSNEINNLIIEHDKFEKIEDRFEGKIIRADNKLIDVDINITSIDKELIMLTIRDISQRKKLEQDKNNNDNTILQMTSNLKLTQEKLINQEKMAGIGQLATGIVHEIFNPLGFVMSNFETLKTYFNDIKYMIEEINREPNISEDKIREIQEKNDIKFILDDVGDLFSDVEDGIFRINAIILNLKKFSRQEVDEFIEYDINDGIQSTLILAKNEYKYIADIVTNLSNLPYTRANASKMNQVLLNLIINASHAIKEKNASERGLITINTFTKDKSIFCEVIDTGIGMSPEVCSKIFQPFYTTKPVGVGTGLGLSISHDIVTKQHNGSINVESEMKKGTKFIIEIPIVESEAD